MDKIKSGVVAAIAVISLASTFVLPTFANQVSSTQDNTSYAEESASPVSAGDDTEIIGVTASPNTGVATDEAPTSRINNTGLLITIAALSVILGIYSLVNILKNKIKK